MKIQIQHSLSEKYRFKWKLNFTTQPLRLALFVSKQLHCLFDILGRWQTKEWEVEIPLIISNHEEAKDITKKFGIDFQYLPITKANKIEQEKTQLKLLEDYNIDLIILARYMHILSGSFINAWRNNIINIHHSYPLS